MGGAKEQIKVLHDRMPTEKGGALEAGETPTLGWSVKAALLRTKSQRSTDEMRDGLPGGSPILKRDLQM